MAEKKFATRFTLQFNEADPQHRQVIEILNQQGRRKSQFLVSAVLHYVTGWQATLPDTGGSAGHEPVVSAITQLIHAGILVPAPREIERLSHQAAHRPDILPVDDGTDFLGEEGIKAVESALGAFRRT